MRKIKMLVFALLALVFVTNPVNVSAKDVFREAGYDYVLSNYNIDVVVHENNTYDITETITADFYVPKHGIFRKIPIYNEVKRQDGSTSKNRAAITNIKVNEQYTTEREDESLVLKIGDADTTLTGEQEYVISYTYNIGKDRLEDADEFYFNLIGTEWDTVINGISFSIEMPKEFDRDKVGFSTGTYGSTGSDFVSYHISGNKITGKVYGYLNAYNGLNARIELPEGYFVDAGIEISPYYYLAYILPVIGLVLSFYLWNKYGKDRKIFIKPEYFPPKGANSLDTAFFYKGRVDSKDVISLLIYLANKGYLKVEEVEGKKGLFGKKKDVKLIKLKDYDGTDANEKTFLGGLFTGRDEVLVSDLYDQFYKTTTKIINNVCKTENKNKLFESTWKWSLTIYLLIVASYALITIPPFLIYGDYDLIPFALIFPIVGLSVISVMARIEAPGGTWALRFFMLFWGLGFGGLPFLAMVLPEIMLVPQITGPYIAGLVMIIGMSVFLGIIPRRTEYGTEKLAEVKGFKMFLESVEKDRIEKMVEEYPTYFYDILPYAYVLGVSQKWMKKFEDMNLKAPDWYDGTDAFSVGYFMGFMNSTMNAANASMASTASHSSGSGGGGGGFSGGGSGGGGGGSW